MPQEVEIQKPGGGGENAGHQEQPGSHASPRRVPGTVIPSGVRRRPLFAQTVTFFSNGRYTGLWGPNQPASTCPREFVASWNGRHLLFL